MFKVDKGVAIPLIAQSENRKLCDFIKTLEDGDSFILGEMSPKLRNRIVSASRALKVTNPNIKITTRQEDNNIRVWVNIVE